MPQNIDNCNKIDKNVVIDISEGSIERALNELLKDSEILKISGGRFSAYIINPSK